MAVHSAIIFVTSLYYLHSFADGRILPLDSADGDTFQPLCSRMCDSSKDFRDNILYPFECSCSQSCAVFGDCCYDSPYKGEREPSEFVCVKVDGLGDFRVVSSCPRNERSDSCPDYLGFLPPVTSRRTNITYGNVFCASCNGDGDDLIRWNVQLRCSSKTDWLQYGLDFNEITHFNDEFEGRNKGEETWRPCKFYVNDGNLELLRDLELRHCDTPREVFRCSSTWGNFSDKQKCRSYVDPVYIQDKPFRNAHCAKCNYMDLDHVECISSDAKNMLKAEDIRFCIANRYRWHQCMAHANSRILSRMFRIDLGTNIKETSCLPPAGKLCCEGEIKDPSTGRCKRTSDPKPACRKGERYDENTDKCKQVKTSYEPTKKPTCRNGERYDENTDKCKQVRTSNEPTKKPTCRKGERYDENTDKCKQVKTIYKPPK